MGFQLFTESGTFNPASWGLKAGDVLQIVCVGGGGGGAVRWYENTNTSSQGKGSNGSASSFGSIVSSAGGNGGAASGTYPLPAYQENSNRGCFGDCTTILGTTFYNKGAGGDGWYPGFISKAGSPWWLYVPWSLQSMSASSNSTTIKGAVGVPTGINAAIYTYKNPIFIGFGGLSQKAAVTTPYGGIGYIGYDNTNSEYSMQIAGFGYGAGGAGANSSTNANIHQSGGNSGQIKMISYALPNINSIAVTVGNGGAGGTMNADSGSYGGGGARGCVAVYW